MMLMMIHVVEYSWAMITGHDKCWSEAESSWFIIVDEFMLSIMMDERFGLIAGWLMCLIHSRWWMFEWWFVNGWYWWLMMLDDCWWLIVVDDNYRCWCELWFVENKGLVNTSGVTRDWSNKTWFFNSGKMRTYTDAIAESAFTKFSVDMIFWLVVTQPQFFVINHYKKLVNQPVFLCNTLKMASSVSQIIQSGHPVPSSM